jgi:hypothetical protein
MFGLSKKALFISVAVLAVIVILTVFLVQQPTVIQQRATQNTPTATPANGIPACEVKEAICRWDSLNNTTQYDVTITEVGKGTIIKQALINHPLTELAFPAEPGKQYQCDVQAKNSCGGGPIASGLGAACPAATPTPTATPGPSDTPTPGPSETPGPSPTPTNGPSSTPTPSTSSGPTATSTAGPTTTPGSTMTPSPTDHTTISSASSPTPTPLTALPPTGLGDNIVTITLIGSTLAILGTFVFVFLW